MAILIGDAIAFAAAQLQLQPLSPTAARLAVASGGRKNSRVSDKFVTILCLEAVTFRVIMPSEKIEGPLRISVLRSLFLSELVA